MAEKLRLTLVAGRPVNVTQRESKLDAARRRYGKPFAFEIGVKFKWSLEPTVLTEWLQRRRWEQLMISTSSSGKERHE